MNQGYEPDVAARALLRRARDLDLLQDGDRHSSGCGVDDGDGDKEEDIHFDWVCLEGKRIPDQCCAEILECLRNLQWPKKRGRKKLTSERYAVLWREKEKEEPRFGTLGKLVEKLMSSVDADYDYTHVAVTKNFVNSPHCDVADTTFQYVCSFGDFALPGGQLAVVGPSDDEDVWCVNVVNTKNRIARVDGRYPHFVLPYDAAKGDRYSLVIFSVKESAATPKAKTRCADVTSFEVPSAS